MAQTFMMVGAYTLAQNNHVRADMFYRKFPIRVQATIDIVLWFLFFYPGIIALIWAGTYFAEMSYRFNEHSVSSPDGSNHLAAQDSHPCRRLSHRTPGRRRGYALHRGA